MKKFFTFFVALVVTSAVMAGNVITYTANWKLSEVSNEMICGDFGLHVDAFNVSIVSHTFSDGVGTIVFSGDVTSVGYQAFAYSSGLTSVTIPESVTSIGDYAFLECPNLTTLAIPNEVTSIGNNAFCKVNNIAYSGTASGAPWGAKCVNGYVEDELVYPDADKTAVVGCFTSAKGAISIPESVTRIGHDAFYNCTGVTSITIPEGVTSIGPSAFLLCTHLRSIVIPKGVTAIASDLFVGCLLLESVTLPEGVERLGSGVFSDCTSLKELRVEAVNPPLVSPDAGTFSSVSKSIPVYVPAGSIESYKAATGWKEFSNYQAIPGSLVLDIVFDNPNVQTVDKDVYQISGLTKNDSLWISLAWSSPQFEGTLTYEDLAPYAQYNNIAFLKNKATHEYDEHLFTSAQIQIECIDYNAERDRGRYVLTAELGTDTCLVNLTMHFTRCSDLIVSWIDFMTDDAEAKFGCHEIDSMHISREKGIFYLEASRGYEFFKTRLYIEGDTLPAGIYPFADNQQPGTAQLPYWNHVSKDIDGTTYTDGTQRFFGFEEGTVEVRYTDSGDMEMEVNGNNGPLFGRTAHIFVTTATTAMPTIESPEQRNVEKFIHDGQLFLRRDDRVYTIHGEVME